MNDDYLWDRTGQPDPEIQELEELLGTLRYQPRPLEIPRDLKIAQQRTFVLPVTIAAAIIMVAILSALWFQFRRKPTLQSVAIQQPTTAPAPAPAPAKVSPPENKEPESVLARDQSSERQQRRPVPRHLIAYRTKALTPRPTAQEQAEKEQVLIALRLVSAKLNLAQRKTQGLPPLNNIRNQHKIG